MLRTLPLVVLLLAVACGGSSEAEPTAASTEPVNTAPATVIAETAAEAMERLLTYASLGQYTREYAMVHPLQQSVVSEETYIKCTAQTPITMTAFRHVETFSETITVPGTATELAVSAVTAEVEINGQTVTDTLYFAEVDGEWRVVLRNPQSTC